MTASGGVRRFAVLGAGSWGSTLADMLARSGHEVSLWDASRAALESLSAKRSPPGVPELQVSENVRFSTSIAEAVTVQSTVVLVVPSQSIAEVSNALAELPNAQRPHTVVLASKGLDVATMRPLADVVSDHLAATIAVVSGPCIAREVARRIPTSVVMACRDDEEAIRLQRDFNTDWFRVYRQGDVLGVELGGALKNVIAIAAGCCDGLGFGDNSKSALLCRGLAEMTRLAVALGAEQRTMFGLAGLGDLTVTCFSPHSRNRRFGEMIAKGASAADAAREIGQVVEGVPTASAAAALAEKCGVDVPIMLTVREIAAGRTAPRDALVALMTRSLKAEF